MESLGVRVRDVCFVHWPVDPGVLATRLPYALSAATRQGTPWVSMVATRIQPLAGPVALPGAFAQVALRTYVLADDEPAVYVLRVDTDSRLAALGARRLLGVTARRVDANVATGDGEAQVRTHAPDGRPLYDATFDRTGSSEPVDPDSLVGWLTDRSTYALDDGRNGRVVHDGWRLDEASLNARADHLLASEGLPRPTADPVVRYSPGTDVSLVEWPS